MSDRSTPPSSSGRPAVALALALGGLAACMPAEPVAAPAVPVPIAAAPRSTPRPSLTPFPTLRPSTPRPRPSGAPLVPLATTGPTPSPEPPPPALATVLASSAIARAPALAPAEAAAVQASLAADAIARLLPADLIHDGGVVLYRLLDLDSVDVLPGGLRPDGTKVPPTPGAGDNPSPSPSLRPTVGPGGTPGPSDKPSPGGSDRPSAKPGDPAASVPPGPDGKPRPRPSETEQPAPDAPPPKWGRQDVAIGKREAIAAKGAAAGTADAEVGYVNRGTFAYKGDGDAEAGKKRFTEVVRRRVALTNGPGGWRVTALGPIIVSPAEGDDALAVATLAARVALTGDLMFTIGATSDPAPLDKQPRVSAGRGLRLEAQIKDDRGGRVFVFGRLSGEGRRDRAVLRDDGVAPDKKAGDGIYTWELRAPDPGTYQLAIDALDARTFARGGPYRAAAMGFTLEVTP